MKDTTVEIYFGDQLKQEKKIPFGSNLVIGPPGPLTDIPLTVESTELGTYLLSLSNQGLFISDTTSGYTLNGQYFTKTKHKLHAGDRILLGIAGQYSLHISALDQPSPITKSLFELLQEHEVVTIGRPGFDNALEIQDARVSGRHAVVSRKGDAFFIEDVGTRGQGSTNGTFINGRRIPPRQPEEFTADDTIYIVLHAFQLYSATLDLEDEPAVRAIQVEKVYETPRLLPGKKLTKVGLHALSLTIQPRQFVALMGPSGCGKSTLMKLLNNSNPATSGTVFLNGLELRTHFPFLKRKIGYVPQDDIVHKDLSVNDTLYLAAKLRMGEGITEEVIRRKIDEVLTSLNINRPDIREEYVGKLSGGQRKRISIAVELLNDPSILFLDEPTSPLDPETIKDFLTCLQRLKQNGTTIVMVTHKPEDLAYVDSVVFLTVRGYIAYHGSRDKQALKDYFGTDEIIEIYSNLSRESVRDTSEVGNQIQYPRFWYEKWAETHKDAQAATAPPSGEARRIKPYKENLPKQYFWQTLRYLKLKLNDKENILLLLLQPVIISLLLSFIYDRLQIGVLFLMAISGIWFGVSNAAKEIVGELSVYLRERMYNLNIATYLLSKITVLSLIAVVQVGLFVAILYLRYELGDLEINLSSPWKQGGFMVFLAVSATLLGLLLSAAFSNAEQVMTVVPIALIPQIMLAGVITQIDAPSKEVLSYFSLGRWGAEGMAHIQDANEDFDRIASYFEWSDTTCELVNTAGVDIVTNSIFYPSPIAAQGNKYYYQGRGGEKVPREQEVDMDNKTAALKVLGFYEYKDRFLKTPRSANPWIAMLILDVLTFVLLYHFMRRKDR